MSRPVAERSSASQEQACRAKDTAWPFVTVFMPVRNEEASIVEAVGGLQRQDYPRDRLEILIADGRSEDRTRHLIRELALSDGRIRLLDNAGKVVPTGLNLALAEARGEILARADGHTLYAPDYVRRAVQSLNESGADVVGGPMIPVGSTPFGRAVAAAHTSSIGVGGSSFHFDDSVGEAEAVYLGIYRRDTFDRYGPFDEFFTRNQDDEWFYRARSSGARIVLDPRIRSIYRPRGDLRSLLCQYFGYGLYKPAVLAKVPRGLRLRHLVPAVFVVVLAGFLLGGIFYRPALVAIAALLCLYLATLTGGALKAVRGREATAVRHVVMAFAAMHVGYGVGFLIGMLRRAPRSDLDGIRETYRHYRDSVVKRRNWSVENPGQALLIDERDQALVDALQEHFGSELGHMRILDLGCGSRDLGAVLEARAIETGKVVGLDLLIERLQESAMGCAIAADARRLPFADASFDAVVQCTMLSSLPTLASRRVVAAEMLRVVRRGGMILSYDARLPNPWNARVRRVARDQYVDLFPGACIGFRPLTVIPALTRRFPRLARSLPRWRMTCAFDLVSVSVGSKGGVKEKSSTT